MPAIARKTFLAALAFVFAGAGIASADQPHDALDVINHVTGALAEGDPADAIAPFDSSMDGYDTLQNQFVGLTQSYQIVNEADVVDEQDSADEIQLTLRWAVTLTGRQTSFTNRKSAQVHLKMRRQKGKWKIVEFAPLDLFAP